MAGQPLKCRASSVWYAGPWGQGLEGWVRLPIHIFLELEAVEDLEQASNWSHKQVTGLKNRRWAGSLPKSQAPSRSDYCLREDSPSVTPEHDTRQGKSDRRHAKHGQWLKGTVTHPVWSSRRWLISVDWLPWNKAHIWSKGSKTIPRPTLTITTKSVRKKQTHTIWGFKWD